ncbi:MAG: FCD domain-containing protein, partial [Beijerinckiaceae bacterium]
EVEANLGIQQIRAEAVDRSAFQKADAEFHALIAKGAGFPHAWETIQNLKQHTDRICKLTLSGGEVLLKLTAQHRGIFGAIRARSSAEAVRLMRDHLSEILRILPDIERRYPEWFS